MITRRIYVLQARWVIIGDVESETTHSIQLVNASVIRVWGTTKGLGEIALNGLTKDTVLDPCGRASIPQSSVLFSVTCRA